MLQHPEGAAESFEDSSMFALLLAEHLPIDW